jgi:hypothetical protein
VPVKRGQKAPAVRWKQYQDIRPDEKRIHQWFSNGRYDALAVVLGPVSDHLACRDFDQADGYEAWSARNANFASYLPTVQTGRGYHVYFRNGNCALTVLGDGELRGSGGVCLLPPSVHPTGKRYEWIVPLGNEVPLIDPVQYKLIPPEGVTEEVRSSGVIEDIEEVEESEKEKQWVVGVRVRDQVKNVIKQYQPREYHTRNRCVFELAHALRSIEGLWAVNPEILRPFVAEWHRRALPNIASKDFEESWFDFCYAWDHIKFEKGRIMAMAIEEAKVNPVSGLPYESPQICLLVSLCWALQARTAPDPFFLSAEKAGEICQVSPMTAYRWLWKIERDGLIKTVEKGNQHRATRFRYIGGNEK